MATDTPMRPGMVGLGRMGSSLVPRRGSVISPWLADLTAEAFARSPDLDGFTGRVLDSAGKILSGMRSEFGGHAERKRWARHAS